MNFFKKYKWKILIIFLAIIVLTIAVYVFYQTIYLDYVTSIEFKLIGDKEITLEVFSEYKEEGSSAHFRDKDITNKVKINGSIDTSKIGVQELEYIVSYKKKEAKLKRKITIVDTVIPEIKLIGNDKISTYVGYSYSDQGVSATDNYDGDISSQVVTDNQVNTAVVGNYKVNYTVTDSSGNSSTISRDVEVKNRPVVEQGVAVLNYHFFYSDGENCGQSICLNTNRFEQQLKYLKDNGYKTLTMDEFIDWMYGRIEVPQKSVLLTIDDGAMGTGLHNGNKLIPLLEKYQVNATLFLITGWWDINNYRSKYLDIESHTYDMHTEGLCSWATRGAKLLCSTYDEVVADLQKSISITGSSDAFCYPFYVYNDTAINAVKAVGFKVAFAGGGYKAKRSSNKYAIPRYPIYDSTSLSTFINYIS